MPVVLIGVRCNYCGKDRAPHDVIDWAGGVKICANCLDWHRKALNAFAGEIPSGCQGCNRSYAELEMLSLEGNVQMYVHGPVDGIYQVFCPLCSEAIRPKQRDRYCGTAFGHEKGL